MALQLRCLDMKELYKLVMWCNGSTNVFGAFSFGSSPDITTNNE